MANKTEPPKIEQKNNNWVDHIETHPAYGMIGASRVTGSTYLFGTDFEHHNTIRLRIHTADLNRSLNRDWPYAKDELIEVEMSEAQWATMISSLNIGHGVCCTIQSINRQQIPGISHPVNKTEQINSEIREKLARAEEHIKKLQSMIEESTMPSKIKKALLSGLLHLYNDLSPNINYVAKAFAEHVEDRIESAKTEINAYLQNVISRAGITAINKATPIKVIEGKKHDDEEN